MKNVLHGQLEVLCFAGHCNISSLNLELGSRPGIEFVSGKGFDLAKSASIFVCVGRCVIGRIWADTITIVSEKTYVCVHVWGYVLGT